MTLSRSTYLLFLSLETLTSIIRTSLPTLVELIHLVNSVIIFLSQMTLLRWLTFLLGSLTMILIVLLFWICLFLLTLVIVAKAFLKPPNLHMLIKRKSPLLPRNLALVTFGELISYQTSVT